MEIQLFNEKTIPFHMIQKTFQASFKQDLDEAYWKWRFLNNPVTDKVYIAYCVESDVLAGYYAVSPGLIHIDGSPKLIAHSNMTMTHPDYQGRGLFKMLSEKLFQELRHDGFLGVYGYANHNSHFGFRKHMGWEDLSILNNFRLDRIRFKKESKVYKVIDKELLDIDFTDTLWVSDNRILLNRSLEYIKWRFIEQPKDYRVLQISSKEKIIANLVYKEYQSSIDIMEVFFSERLEDQLHLWTSICTSVFNDGYESINIWSNLFSEEHLLLEKLGFLEQEFCTYFGVIPFKELPGDLFLIKNWHYRFADSDVY